MNDQKSVQNVTKLLPRRPGLRDTQVVNTKSGKKPVKIVTKLTYEDIKQRIPPEDELEVDKGTREPPQEQLEDEKDFTEVLK